MQVLNQRYPDIRIEGENYLPQPIYRHIASFLSMFKLAVIGLIILGKDPFAFFGMQTPGLWLWAQENKIYACMMVFFLSNMIENQCMSTGAFEITLNDVPVWSKLESGHLPSMQQLVQILENEMKLNPVTPSPFKAGVSTGREAMPMKACAKNRSPCRCRPDVPIDPHRALGDALPPRGRGPCRQAGLLDYCCPSRCNNCV
ncbi:hypothetical protein MATL_G00242030 [Megalops atlanticus]|uniref:Selenoprotein T n=1 Tax=Megalops atlanticus TaxID=7932 RepID=A0A9D3SVS9_MEGAT|nr:hypothetical protein MATL_G00242030 [Megalops atlanticus]